MSAVIFNDEGENDEKGEEEENELENQQDPNLYPFKRDS